MDLSICIVSYNCRDLLAACLDSIEAHRGDMAVEIIVTDNASSDGTVEMLRQRSPAVTVIANEENAGFAAGTNQAMSLATGETLVMLNPDTQIATGALESLVGFLRERPEVAAAGPSVVDPDGSLQTTAHSFPTLLRTVVTQVGLHRILPRYGLLHNGSASCAATTGPRQVDWLSGVCMAIRRAAWERVGPLDEGFFMYSEDVDWCYRASLEGYECWYLPEARIMHHEGASWGDAPRERILAAHRAGFRFFGKNYGHCAEVTQRVLVALGALARGTAWTILGPAVEDRHDLVTSFETHFRVAELAMEMKETHRRSEGRVS